MVQDVKPVVLMFAYHFPPEPEIGAARPARFYKYLKKLGYTCQVITAVPQGEKPPEDVLYVPDFFLEKKRRCWKWQMERAFRWALFPGAVGLGWSHDAYIAARQILQRQTQRPAIIL